MEWEESRLGEMWVGEVKTDSRGVGEVGTEC
jgi:hypothetical protein